MQDDKQRPEVMKRVSDLFLASKHLTAVAVAISTLHCFENVNLNLCQCES